MKKILFLGYDKDKTQQIEQIQTHNNHWEVKQTSKKDLPKLLKNWNQNIYETVIENNRMYKKNEK